MSRGELIETANYSCPLCGSHGTLKCPRCSGDHFVKHVLDKAHGGGWHLTCAIDGTDIWSWSTRTFRCPSCKKDLLGEQFVQLSDGTNQCDSTNNAPTQTAILLEKANL